MSKFTMAARMADSTTNSTHLDRVINMRQKEMIDIKFNELAKRIFDELKQSRYSDEFFHAIDDVLRKPLGRKQATSSSSSRRQSVKSTGGDSNNSISSSVKSKRRRDLAAPEAHQSNQKSHTQIQQQQQQPSRIQRFNRIVRSNTIANANLGPVTNGDRGHEILDHHDLKNLYKPHMNYSTSLLGNHRLSDDDEIIIIPTTSPSLVSTSTDRESPNTDEQSQDVERFSISRTKNFWEKLSNRNGNSSRPVRSLTQTFSTFPKSQSDCESFNYICGDSESSFGYSGNTWQ